MNSLLGTARAARLSSAALLLLFGIAGCGGGHGGTQTASTPDPQPVSPAPQPQPTPDPTPQPTPTPPPQPVDESRLYIQGVETSPQFASRNSQVDVIVRVGNSGSGRSRPCGVEIRGTIRYVTGVADVPITTGRIPEVDPGQTYEFRQQWNPSTSVRDPAGQWDVYARLKSWMAGQVVSDQSPHAGLGVGG